MFQYVPVRYFLLGTETSTLEYTSRTVVCAAVSFGTAVWA